METQYIGETRTLQFLAHEMCMMKDGERRINKKGMGIGEKK